MTMLKVKLVIVARLRVRDRREEDGISVATLHTIGPHEKLVANAKIEEKATKHLEETIFP